MALELNGAPLWSAGHGCCRLPTSSLDCICARMRSWMGWSNITPKWLILGAALRPLWRIIFWAMPHVTCWDSRISATWESPSLHSLSWSSRSVWALRLPIGTNGILHRAHLGATSPCDALIRCRKWMVGGLIAVRRFITYKPSRISELLDPVPLHLDSALTTWILFVGVYLNLTRVHHSKSHNYFPEIAEVCLNKRFKHMAKTLSPSSARCHGRAGCSTAESLSRNAVWFEALGPPRNNYKQFYGNLHQFTTLSFFFSLSDSLSLSVSLSLSPSLCINT